MTLELVTIPCLADNYAFLLHDDESRRTLLVDAPESWPIVAALEARGWTLSDVLLTHHHYDHVDGLDDLRQAFDLEVTGAAADAHRLPKLDRAVAGGETFDWSGHAIAVLDVPGHTLGHVAYYIADAGAVFTGDSLMALGCGRLFEGSAAQMWESLGRIAALPGDTRVCSGHEYTEANGAFALTIEPGNEALVARMAEVRALRAKGDATVPSLLSLELATNPFLRADLPQVRAALGMEGAQDAEVFAEIRRRKDDF